MSRINSDDGRVQELVHGLQAERERMNTLVAKLEVQIAEATKRAEGAEAAAQHFGNEWAKAVQLGTKLSEQWAAATKRAEQADATVAELVAANNQVAAINAGLTERVADLEAKLAALPPEAIALANHIWRKQRAEPEPQSNP